MDTDTGQSIWQSFLSGVGSRAVDFKVVLVGARMFRELYQIARTIGVEEQLDAQKARTVRLVVQKKGWLIDQMSDYFNAFVAIDKAANGTDEPLKHEEFENLDVHKQHELREARKTMALFGNDDNGVLDFRGQHD